MLSLSLCAHALVQYTETFQFFFSFIFKIKFYLTLFNYFVINIYERYIDWNSFLSNFIFLVIFKIYYFSFLKY